MEKPDVSIDPRILDSTKKEFLVCRYEKASLKAICQSAEITTGTLYKRHKDKEPPFCAVVAIIPASTERQHMRPLSRCLQRW